MASHTVSQARSFKENPRHYPRKLQVGIYNTFSKRLPYHPLPSKPQSILIQAQEKIGDAILLFPVIGGLKKRFPESTIHLLCSSKNEHIFYAHKDIDKTMIYRTGRRFWQILRETHYDLFYNPKDHPSITGFKIAKSVRADVKVCIADRRQEQHYNYGLTVNQSQSVLEKNGAILRAYDFGFEVEPSFPNVDLSNPKGKNIISINLSAGSESRKWSLNNWISLIDLIIKDNEKTAINLFGYGKEVKQSQKIKERFNAFVNLCQIESILDAGPIIQKSSILISPDTAMVHVADAVGTAIVGLYSGDNRNVGRYRPYWVAHKILQSPTLSIEQIEPSIVFSALKELMND
ncbi:MAG: glycosyltransferase family 9 protein [Candidatus Marinimicrobia bacterium]|nr:glycosyltransferase family 9 protein [Candidatus Neomarinimicrobiota bacterium]MBL7029622.1 glycosyltransferase family 9 protein [Candidatus Neomarinimicrobiota bacterium]